MAETYPVKKGLLGYIKSRFLGDPPLHPIDRKLAKMWIKKRLVAVFPELQNNPEALELAYRQLDLERRPDMRQNEPHFELMSPFEL